MSHICQTGNPLVEVSKSLIMRLTSMVAVINLLENYRYLEERKDFVKTYLTHIATRLLRIPVDYLGTLHTYGKCIYRAYRIPPRFVVILLGPVTEQNSEIDQRIADSRHLPVKDSHHARRIRLIQHDIVELVVIVHQ